MSRDRLFWKYRKTQGQSAREKTADGEKKERTNERIPNKRQIIDNEKNIDK